MNFERAKARADQLGKVIRASGDYPLLGRGDINLYSLFVERAMNLVKPEGLVGLLTPSGIYGDKTAANFFKQVSTRGQRIRPLRFRKPKDFLQRRSRVIQVLCVDFRRKARSFARRNQMRILPPRHRRHKQRPDRCFSLTPDDFDRVNPNTGNAPVFRTRRDADITRRIYEQHPVLVDRSGAKKRNRVWPVKVSANVRHDQRFRSVSYG